jgi:hypothetical protein
MVPRLVAETVRSSRPPPPHGELAAMAAGSHGRATEMSQITAEAGHVTVGQAGAADFWASFGPVARVNFFPILNFIYSFE